MGLDAPSLRTKRFTLVAVRVAVLGDEVLVDALRAQAERELGDDRLTVRIALALSTRNPGGRNGRF
ncbi:MAG: hypothetical protein IPH13_12090 [Planctomycetes bacterium]|nr:hypothetical protein [Planctomycetota bacterium]